MQLCMSMGMYAGVYISMELYDDFIRCVYVGFLYESGYICTFVYQYARLLTCVFSMGIIMCLFQPLWMYMLV